MALTPEQILEIAGTPAAIPGSYIYSVACAIEAEVRKQDDALIAQMLDFLEDVQDEGPIGEGWKSDKLMAVIAVARARLDSTARRKHV